MQLGEIVDLTSVDLNVAPIDSFLLIMETDELQATEVHVNEHLFNEDLYAAPVDSFLGNIETDELQGIEVNVNEDRRGEHLLNEELNTAPIDSFLNYPVTPVRKGTKNSMKQTFVISSSEWQNIENRKKADKELLEIEKENRKASRLLAKNAKENDKKEKQLKRQMKITSKIPPKKPKLSNITSKSKCSLLKSNEKNFLIPSLLLLLKTFLTWSCLDRCRNFHHSITKKQFLSSILQQKIPPHNFQTEREFL